MEKSEVLSHLRKYIAEKQIREVTKEEQEMLFALETLREEEIFFGEPPKYFVAYIQCNSTGVGKSSFQGSETQRTVARDYVTDEFLFVDGHEGAGGMGLSVFVAKPGEIVNYYYKSDIEKVAKEEGLRLHRQYFNDLNMLLISHRLNRHTVKITKGPFSYPIRPILAAVSDDGKVITLGYVYDKDGMEYIIIEPKLPERAKKISSKGCAICAIGVLLPPVGIIALIVWAVRKYSKL